ncbi:LacI family DNA-binding transcriptional regulator [Nesterenkonia haasae]|uniref:LacI family DNA-binding transcriptional regulator n=1 Tax=Nesterenkonia haasae TaxID=2587813 RepID=UPI002E2CA027|nr:LacI family DNA-binding transcriptional regulator [Nesterenkonia haasae]
MATEAGVSPATVSRVMNGRFVGADEIAERVLQAAARLDYSPSYSARSLALGHTQAVAFVAPDLRNPAFQTILSGLSATAGDDGYRVLIGDSAESVSEEPLLAREVRRRCDALVLCAPRMDQEELSGLAPALQPMVLINRSGGGAVPTLNVDYYSGIRSLLEHLHDLGHRRIAYVSGPAHSASNEHRRAGIRSFRDRHPETGVIEVAGGASSQDGFEAVDSVLRAEVSAVLAFNDLVAIGLIGGLQDQGRSVPEDISVAGFDDIPFARYIAPPLTTASVPHEELGIQAWYRLRALIKGQEPAHDVVFQPRLEVRSSTAAPQSSPR